jgi:flagellar biosynthesis/type III secretory pathway M-ring protein FliF/YscJ
MTPTTVERTAETPGKIESLAAAVFVDLSALAGDEVKEGEAAAVTKITPKEIREAVGNTLGLEKTKWDSAITVVDVPFQTASLGDEAVQPEGPGMMGMVLQHTKDFSLGIAVLGILMMFKIMSGKKAKASEMTESTASAEGVASAGAGAGSASARGGSKQLTGPDRQLRTKIVNALSSNPEHVKQLFLSWVESDGGK